MFSVPFLITERGAPDHQWAIRLASARLACLRPIITTKSNLLFSKPRRQVMNLWLLLLYIHGTVASYALKTIRAGETIQCMTVTTWSWSKPVSNIHVRGAKRHVYIFHIIDWSEAIVGSLSNWLELDSSDQDIRVNSELALAQELAWACHLSLFAVMSPKLTGSNHTNMARVINQAVVTMATTQVSRSIDVCTTSDDW